MQRIEEKNECLKIQEYECPVRQKVKCSTGVTYVLGFERLDGKREFRHRPLLARSVKTRTSSATQPAASSSGSY